MIEKNIIFLDLIRLGWRSRNASESDGVTDGTKKIQYKTFKTFPSEITILTYDALGLIYYAWKKNGKINSTNEFSFKSKIKGN